MINDSIKIHDKYQFEIKLSYLLKDSTWSEFFLEAYIFLPGSLGINKFTYPGEDFYKDVKHLIRFRAPEFSFGELLHSSESPLNRLKANSYKKSSKINFEACEYDVKVFCNVARRTLKNHFLWLKKQDELPFKDAIEDFYNDIRKLEREFRTIAYEVESSDLDNHFKKLFSLADEYICILFQNYVFEILEHFKEIVFSTNLSFKKELLDFVKSEQTRQVKKKYPSIPTENDDNEELFYRKAIFKKYFSSPLFLKSKYNKESERIQQLIFSIAAGIAMFFAVMFTVLGGLSLQLGNTSATVIFMLVVGYMFKDRIKELSRIYISQQVLQKLYDNKWNLFSQHNDKLKVGHSKEMFYFIKETKLPKLIRKIRNHETLIPVEDESIRQRVIYYKKNLKLKSNLKKSAFNGYSINRMNDIIRFNVRSFIRNMDEEEKELFILKNDDYYKTEGERVYHINVILKLTDKSEEIYRRVRVVLTQNGIKRIESVDINQFLLN